MYELEKGIILNEQNKLQAPRDDGVLDHHSFQRHHPQAVARVLPRSENILEHPKYFTQD